MQVKNKIVVFDSSCVLCNSAVRFIFKMDKKKNLFYTSFESNYLKKIRNPELKTENADSVIFINENKIYYKSDAALFIAKELKSPIKYLFYLKFIPRFIRDNIYDFIARHRYKMFGQTNSCNFDPDLNKQILH